jgi:CHAT domain-containing protein
MRRAIVRTLAIALLSAGLVPVWARGQAAADEAAVNQVVERFFAAYAQKDLAGFLALWSAKAPDYAFWKKRAAEIFAATDRIEVKDLTVLRTEVSGDTARVRTGFELVGNDRQTGKPYPAFGKLKRAFELVREGRDWRVRGYGPVERELAAALAAAPDRAARRRLLDRDKDLIAKALLDEIHALAIAQQDQRQFAEALRLNDVALEVAEVLGDKVQLGWCRLLRGAVFSAQQRWPAAREQDQQALALFREVQDADGEALALFDIGNVDQQTHKLEEALAAYEAGLRIVRRLGQPARAAFGLHQIGSLHYLLRRYDRARAAFEEALKICTDLDDRAGQARNRRSLGLLLKDTGQPAEALAQYQASLEAARAGNHPGEEAGTLATLGLLHQEAGRDAEALAALEAALKIVRALTNRAGEAQVLHLIGALYAEQGKRAEALRAYQAGLKLAEAIPDQRLTVTLLNAIADFSSATGKAAEALAAVQQSLRIARAIGDQPGEARALQILGQTYQRQGKYAEALAQLQTSLALARSIADREREAGVLNDLGLVYKATYKPAEARARLEAALRLFRELKVKKGEAAALVNLGHVHAVTLQDAEALRAYQEGLQVAQAIGAKAVQAEALTGTGLISWATNKYAEAVRAHEASLKLAQEVSHQGLQARAFGGIGRVRQSTGNYAAALQAFTSALKLAQAIADQAEQAAALREIGLVLRTTGKPTEGLRALEASLRLAYELGDKAAQAQTLEAIGQVQQFSGRFAEALRAFEASLRLCKEVGNHNGQALALYRIGSLNRTRGQRPAALQALEASRTLWRQMGDKAAQADALRELAAVHTSTGNHTEALRLLAEGLKLARAVGYGVTEALTLDARAQVYRVAGRYVQALQEAQASVALFRRLGVKDGEALAVHHLGLVHQELGHQEEAERAFRASLQLARAVGDRVLQATAHLALGTLLQETGKRAEALQALEASLQTAQQSGAPAPQVAAWASLGTLHRAAGDYGEALRAFEASLRLAEQIGDPEGQALARAGFGEVYSETGKPAEALEAYRALLTLSRQRGLKKVEAMVLNKIGWAHLLAGLSTLGAGDRLGGTPHLEEAAGALQLGSKLLQEMFDKRGEAVTLLTLGLLEGIRSRTSDLVGLGGSDYPAAVRAYEASLKLAREIGHQGLEASVLGGLGWVQLWTGKPDQALEAFAAALRFHERSGHAASRFVCDCYKGLGDTHRSRGHWEQAAQAYRQAIGHVERLRRHTREHSLQTGLFETFTSPYGSPYHALAECLRQLGAPGEEVWAVAEQVKARTLVDLMQNGKVNIVKDLTGAERRTEQELDGTLTALSLQLTTLQAHAGADPKQLEALRQQLDQARAAYADYERRLYFAHPELQTLRAQFAPVTLTQLNQTLFAREPKLCLLSYLVGFQETLLFVVTRGRDPHGPATVTPHRLVLELEELRQEVEDFRRWCQKPGAAFRYDTQQLYRWLLAPAAQELAGATHLVLVPDGLLHVLPFHALRDPQGRYLIETHAVSYAQSVTALVEMVKKAEARRQAPAPPGPAGPSLLAVGRPTLAAGLKLKDLPASEAEAKAIAGLFGQQAFLGAQADKATVQAALAQARYVHLATHGLLNEAAGMHSAIALAPREGRDDGLLHARELLALDLRAELVVLSACQTALGQPVSGEGVVGLTWALFVAGAPSSVVSLWLVDDDSTRALMEDFYRRLTAGAEKGQGATGKAEALRQAQLRLLKGKDGPYQHPFYWAPFVLVGDWRQ